MSVVINLRERDRQIYRHSITAERNRHKFIIEYDRITRDMRHYLLLFSNTGKDEYVTKFCEILSTEFNKFWIEFIKQEGFFE